MRIYSNSYALAVAVALLIASVLLGVYYAALMPEQEGYMTVYVLDSQKKAFDYPEVVVAGENSTFSVYVTVENHMGNTTACQIRLKVTKDMNPTFPVDVDVNATETFVATVDDGKTWEIPPTTISLNEPGDYLVVFELWIGQSAENTETFQFSKDLAVLNVQVL